MCYSSAAKAGSCRAEGLGAWQVRVEPFADSKTGYKIVFVFTENPYFEDEVLSKEVHFTEAEDHPTVTCRVTGCQPTWKDEVRTGKQRCEDVDIWGCNSSSPLTERDCIGDDDNGDSSFHKLKRQVNR